MAKKYIIYASGKDLATVGVTQNEFGAYYWNGSSYFKPILAEFDKATPPVGYKKYLGGSHTVYISNANRNPIDFSIVSGASISMNVDVNVTAVNPSDGSWCKVNIVGSDIIIAFVHTYQWVRGLVKAGDVICKIAPQSVTGFAPHLHTDEWSNRGLKIRKLILDGDFNMSTFKIGDRVEFTDVQNIRSGAGDKFEEQRQTVIGELATIKDGSRTSQNKQFGKGANDGYIWWDMKFDNGGSGWVAMVNKFKVYTPPIIIPVDPVVELNKQIEALKTEITGLKEALGTSQNSLRLSQERVKFLEEGKKTWEEEIVKLEGEVLKVKQESTDWHNQYIDKVTELNAYKEGRFIWVVDLLEKLFPKKK